MDDFEKKIIGYGLVAVIETIVLIAVELAISAGFKPLMSIAIGSFIAIFGFVAGAIIRHRFGLPVEEPEPIPLPELANYIEGKKNDFTIEVDPELIGTAPFVSEIMHEMPVVEAATEEAIEEAIEDLDAKIEELKKEE